MWFIRPVPLTGFDGMDGVLVHGDVEYQSCVDQYPINTWVKRQCEVKCLVYGNNSMAEANQA